MRQLTGFVAFIAVILLISSFALAGFIDDQEHKSNKDRLIVFIEDASAVGKLQDLAASHGSKMQYNPSLGAVFWENWNYRVKQTIDNLQGVKSVQNEVKAHAMFTPNDSYYTANNQWGVERISASQAWDFTLGSHNVTIAVLDTGIDYTHDDLFANMWRDNASHYGYDFWNDDYNPMDDNINGYEGGVWKPNVYTYHGTHVAGIAGAVTNNGLGIAGIAQVKLMAVKVMNDSGEGTDATVAEGITYAVDNGANIITMSLGVDTPTIVLGHAIDYAASKGVVLVAAAGNEGSSSVAYPAAYPEVIAVGATDQLDHRASFSNYGIDLDLMAPGTRIWSTRPGDSYQELSGTSTATPFVAGVAALMLSVNPALTPSKLSEVINQTTDDIGSTGWDSTTGWGIVNAYAAVSAVSGPAATITDYPQATNPNSTVTVKWVVSGAGNLPIQSTYLRWGYSQSNLDHISGTSYGNTTPHSYVANDLKAASAEGQNLHVQAVAVVNGIEYISSMIHVNTSVSANDPFSNLLSSINNFILNDLGLFNFILIIIIIVAAVILVLVLRASKRAKLAHMPAPLQPYYATQPQPTSMPQPPPAYAPPPIPIPEVLVEVISAGIAPAVLEIIEGTRVIWRNREWAPPPGISIVSGFVDQAGHHPDGLFSSGMMVAPGEYWSCIFNAPGVYPYYIGNLNQNGKIIVRKKA